MPIPFIKHAISVEHTEIERAGPPLSYVQNTGADSVYPKPPLKKWNLFPLLKLPIIASNPALFQLRLFDAMRPIDAHNRVILAEFPYWRVGLKCCSAISQKTADTTDTTLTWLRFFNKEKRKIPASRANIT